MFNTLLNLFFPKVCYACSKHLNDNENDLCIPCRHSLPVTNFHFNNDDTVLKIFYGRVKIENATALFRFEKKGIVQHLIHQLKYKDKEAIGLFLGDWLGGELSTLNTYKKVDMVIPVPLHEKKLKKRGYNQVAKFGQQIANSLNITYADNVLLKGSNTESQTLKSRLFRWNDTDELFILKNAKSIENKHILLVDDMITTGATIEACITVLNQVPSVKISVASMAIAT
ncbi:amidophosphoribosyltransferase [Pseudalgibacter alginicilyticus]|uniref:Amidophosphoribosyltransferase n=1 Tax=Pseudalgibacter alginicilyticus TaxID=1736674 RepID=A0A0N7HYP9_9FLAO|nr:phosphoribosyltransferase family protein [Pseudalgibacter alginicilyticus]ALJ05862.1 amidophosphoribosyltransferase [Pseudalgibacter alginicilyticus]